jgi:uncharacterized protein (DUF3084 family)
MKNLFFTFMIVSLLACGSNSESGKLELQLQKLQQAQASSDRLTREVEQLNIELEVVTTKLVQVKVERDKLRQELKAWAKTRRSE